MKSLITKSTLRRRTMRVDARTFNHFVRFDKLNCVERIVAQGALWGYFHLLSRKGETRRLDGCKLDFNAVFVGATPPFLVVRKVFGPRGEQLGYARCTVPETVNYIPDIQIVLGACPNFDRLYQPITSVVTKLKTKQGREELRNQIDGSTVVVQKTTRDLGLPGPAVQKRKAKAPKK